MNTRLYTLVDYIMDNAKQCPNCHELWFGDCGTCRLNRLTMSLQRHVALLSRLKISIEQSKSGHIKSRGPFHKNIAFM